MKKISNKLLFTIVIVALIVVGAIYYLRNDSIKDLKIAALLERDVLPYVQEKNITFYFNMDWCKAIKYDSRSVVKVLNTNNNSVCLSNAADFSVSDQVVFDQLRNKLDSISAEQFREIDIEHPVIYRPEQTSFPYESIGTAFHFDCSFCRTRYVYWPNYRELPPNIQGEIKYIPINKDWYRVELDWN